MLDGTQYLDLYKLGEMLVSVYGSLKKKTPANAFPIHRSHLKLIVVLPGLWLLLVYSP